MNLETDKVRRSRAHLAGVHTLSMDWHYTQPETSTLLKSDSLISLVQLVVRHRKFKELERDDFYSVLEDVELQLCSTYPGNCKNYEGPVFQDNSVGFNKEKLTAFNAAVFEFLKSKKWEAVEEVDRRSMICQGCVLMKPAKLCDCQVAITLVRALLPGRRRRHTLGLCKVCGCFMEAKVNIPKRVVDKSNEIGNYTYPSWCWQNKEQDV